MLRKFARAILLALMPALAWAAPADFPRGVSASSQFAWPALEVYGVSATISLTAPQAVVTATNVYAKSVSGTAGTFGTLTTTGALNFSGGLLTAGTISAAAINVTGTTGTISATNVYAKSVSGSTGTFGSMAGLLTTAAQTNITSVGTLTGLTMGGNIVATGYNVSATNLFASSVSGSTGTFGTIAGTLSTAAQGNITSVGTLTGLTVNGTGTFTTVTATNVYGGSVSGSTGTFGSIGTGAIAMTGALTGPTSISTSAAGVVSAEAVNAAHISGTAIAGTLTTAAQPNITSVGSLTGLTVTGTYNGISDSGVLNVAGAISGSSTAMFAGALTLGTNSVAGSINFPNGSGNIAFAGVGKFRAGTSLLAPTISSNAGTGTGVSGSVTGAFVSGSLAVNSATVIGAGAAGITPTTAMLEVYGLISGTTLTASGVGTFGGLLTANAGIVATTISTTGNVSASTAYVGGLTEGTISGTNPTISVANAGLSYLTVTGTVTISLTNGAPGKSVQIFVKQPSGGGAVVNWVSPTHHWANPTFTSGSGLTSTTVTTSASTVSQYSWTTPDGSNWYGGLVGSGM